jgi:hypothetical protein
LCLPKDTIAPLVDGPAQQFIDRIARRIRLVVVCLALTGKQTISVATLLPERFL